MKKGISALQIGVFIACGVGIVLAVLLFSDKLPIGKNSADQKVSGDIVMWGTLPFESFQIASEGLKKTYPDVRFQYIEKRPETFQSELVNALASGIGPDIITTTPADMITNRDRILAIPFESLPQSTYLNTFVAQSSQFLTSSGVMAFPFIIDPLVMYVNRDLLTSAFSLRAPETWAEVAELGKTVTKKNDAGDLSVQNIALGTFDNIRHAKEIILMLIFQAGNKLVTFDSVQNKYVSTFADSSADGTSGVSSALRFYTEFANPNQLDRYSWNSGLPLDQDQFIAGKLALYLGNASELKDIRQKNPNLNFDIALMPQRSVESNKVTYGTMMGISVVKFSKNPTAALLVAQELVKAPVVTAYLVANPWIAPARRDLLQEDRSDARVTLIARSAIISQSFLDPDIQQTNNLFRKVINDINSGATNPDSILSSGNSLLKSILDKIQP